MGQRFCPVCCTEHSQYARCPGELIATDPEQEGWRVAAETPRGIQGYGVLLAPVGARWRARILTYPRTLWVVPGGGATLKFLGRTPEEAERKAARFIRDHCTSRGYMMRDEIELVGPVAPAAPSTSRPHAIHAGDPSREPRFARELPLLFGGHRPNVPARCRNLSASGLFVQTEHPLSEGALAGVLLELEHGKVPLRGEVQWARQLAEPGRPAGMGLRLLDPPSIYTSYVRALA